MPGAAIFTLQKEKRDELRQSAQDQALRNLSALNRRKTALHVEREILMAEIKQARRQHKAASSEERELQAVVTELLSIG